MVLKHIKKFIFAGITAGLCLYSGSMSAKEVITPKEVITHLCDKTMTSAMMEDYLRNNRLKERMQVWKDDLQAWKQRWDVVLDENFKLDSLTDEAFDELCEIPFYMFAADMLGEADLPWQLQEEFFEKVYMHSDDDALEALIKIHEKLGFVAEAKEIAKEIFEREAQGYCLVSKHLFKPHKFIFINDLLMNEAGQLDIPFLLFVFEHELTHIEQGLDAAALEIMAKKYFNNKEILHFLECIKRYKNIFVSEEPRDLLQMTTRFAYELYAFIQNSDECDNFTVSDLSNYDLCSDEIEDLGARVESEADKRAIRFITCPMLIYHQYKHFDTKDEIDPRGYFSKSKITKLLVERLVAEGRMLSQNLAPRIVSKKRSRKFIWWPSEHDRKELAIFYQDRVVSYDDLLQSAL